MNSFIQATIFFMAMLCQSLTETVSSSTVLVNNTLPSDQLGMVWPFSNSNNPSQADYPFSSSFGPRLKASQSFRHDFHRGIDIPRPNNTALYAVCTGIVFRNRTSQSGDHYMALRCNNSNDRKLAGRTYVYPIYRHLKSAVLAENAPVTKGALIAYSGESTGGFDHLHLDFGDGGSYETNNTHPLQYLPYDNINSPQISKFTGDSKYFDSSLKKVRFNVTVDSSQLDLKNISVAGNINNVYVNVVFDFVKLNQITYDKPLLDNELQVLNGTTVIVRPERHNQENVKAAYEATFDFSSQISRKVTGYRLILTAGDVRGSHQKVTVSS